MKKAIRRLVTPLLLLSALADPGQAEQLMDKNSLQEQSLGLLAEIDSLRFNSMAIYVDQSPDNLCDYSLHYLKADYLLHHIEQNVGHWEKQIKRNRNDKVFQVFKASMQLGLYAIYSRDQEFLSPFSLHKADKISEQLTAGSCLKRIKKRYTDWATERIKDIPEMGGHDEIKAEWQDKASSALGRAREAISRALQIDPDYKDALIIEAQMLAMSGQYQEARTKFEEIAEMGYFDESRSYLNSWLAHLALQQGQVLQGGQAEEADEESLEQQDSSSLSHRELLRKAAGYSEPYANKEWATKMRAALVSRDKKELRFTFPPTTTIEDDFDLGQLYQQSSFLINGLRAELLKSLDQKKGIRKPLPPAVNKDLASYALSHEYVLTDLATDKSELNFSRHDQLVDNIYRLAVMMEQVIGLWDQLAQDNEQSRAYYLLNKSSCGLTLLESLQASRAIVSDPAFQLWQEKAHKKKEAKRKEQVKRQGEVWFERQAVDYRSRWGEWLSKLQRSLPGDIELTKGQLFAGQLLDFEYQALTAEPATALAQLAELEQRLKRGTIRLSPENHGPSDVADWQLCSDCQGWEELDNWRHFSQGSSWRNTPAGLTVEGKAYIAAWRAYLAAKAGNSSEAEQQLARAERIKGMEGWEEYQEKVLYLKKALATQ